MPLTINDLQEEKTANLTMLSLSHLWLSEFAWLYSITMLKKHFLGLVCYCSTSHNLSVENTQTPNSVQSLKCKFQFKYKKK